MDSKELRIGNWYNHPLTNGMEPSQIVAVDFISEFIDLFKPIPLTEEWLIKFEFEIDGYGGQGNCYTDAHLPSNKEYPNSAGLYLFRHDQDNPERKWQIGLRKNKADSSYRIKHVHQLQNLYFALTGEELKIKQ